MKKSYFCVFSILFLILINVYPAKAQDYNTFSRRLKKEYLKKHSGEIDLKLLDFTYKEPDYGVKDQGEMSGIGMAYTYHDNLMLKLALDYYRGKINYESVSGKMNNVPHYILDFRWLIGPDLPESNYQSSYNITPYTGFGLRFWKDDSGGKITDIGKYGYDRKTTYFYSPLGLEIIKISKYKWLIGALVEFDFLWQGKNKSYLSNVDPEAPDLEVSQDSGYGFRFDLRVEKGFDKIKIGIVPFIHYWDINKSDEKRLFDPTDYNYWVFFEPENNTTELGIRFLVKF